MRQKIALTVIGIHLALICLMVYSPRIPRAKTVTKLVVHTEKFKPKSVSAPAARARPTPPVKKAASKPAPQKPKPAAQKPKPAVKPKPAQPAPIIESKAPPKMALVDPKKKAVLPKKAPPPPEPEYEEAPVKQPPLAAKLNIPKAIGSLEIDQKTSFTFGIESEHPLDYESQLISQLHEALYLPEHGEVKIELQLRKDGSVAKMVVLKAESVKNKHYLEKNLPSLRFPLLSEDKKFVLTFCNEL